MSCMFLVRVLTHGLAAEGIMSWGHMEPLESLLSGHESHCHVQELAKFHERCLQGKAVDMVKEHRFTH